MMLVVVRYRNLDVGVRNQAWEVCVHLGTPRFSNNHVTDLRARLKVVKHKQKVVTLVTVSAGLFARLEELWPFVSRLLIIHVPSIESFSTSSTGVANLRSATDN